HPNVVAVLDHGDDQGQPFLVMERLPGRTLRDRLAEGPMTSDEVRKLGLEVLGGLAAAHAVDVIHRDVKPGNVLEANGSGPDPALSAAIVRAMASDPRDRFADTNAFAGALEDRADPTLTAVRAAEPDGTDQTMALPPLDATTPMPTSPDTASPPSETASRTPLRDVRG